MTTSIPHNVTREGSSDEYTPRKEDKFTFGLWTVGHRGGGAKSPLWRQILADVLGVELVTTNAHEGPAFGAALLAGVASGAYHSIQQACDSMVRLVEHTEPRPEIEQVYARKYETYRALYPALKPILSSPS